MRGAELLNKRVLTGGIELGRVVDVILDEEGDRPIGLDVRCKDGEHRFLPLATADVGDGDVLVDSPLMLLERDQLDFYRARGRALRSAR
jgi:sporulation protein YlmC with PRC-barrel domain